MATRAGISSNIVNRLGDDHQQIFFAIKAEFDTDDILLWTGQGDIVIDSETYTGAGSFLTISGVEDVTELRSTGLSLGLSGMDDTVLDYALTENYQNRPITLFMGFQMGGSNEIAGVMTLFKGRMITLSITDSPTGSTITLDCENRLIDLRRPSNLRYTKESQEFLFTGDKGLDRIASLQDKEITWGRGFSSGAGGAIGSTPYNDKKLFERE